MKYLVLYVTIAVIVIVACALIMNNSTAGYDQQSKEVQLGGLYTYEYIRVDGMDCIVIRKPLSGIMGVSCNWGCSK